LPNDPTIPLPRIVGEGDTGLDVLAYRRALHTLGLVPHARQGHFEATMLEGVLAFQEHANITRTGTIGRRTYAVLFRHIDTAGRSKLETFARRQKVRDRMVAEQRWALRNEARIHYPPGDIRATGETATALRRWQEHELPITLDCSEYAVCIAAAAGAPDPTGTSFGLRGSVFTGTMLGHSREIGAHELKPGDYVVLGPPGKQHACVVLSVDDPENPMLTSHGLEAGPLEIALNDVKRFHDPPVRFLSAGIM
jgi:Putative peptidoglycan binding domain